MEIAFRRACSVLLVVVATAVAGEAQAATVTVSLVPAGDEEIEVPLGGVNTMLLRENSWGNVVHNGVIVGTFVLRLEYEVPNVQDSASQFPTPAVRLTIRLRPTPSFDTIVMQGTVPGAPSGAVLFFGNVTVATGTLVFLQGATFHVEDLGGAGGSLTLTY